MNSGAVSILNQGEWWGGSTTPHILNLCNEPHVPGHSIITTAHFTIYVTEITEVNHAYVASIDLVLPPGFELRTSRRIAIIPTWLLCMEKSKVESCFFGEYKHKGKE